MQPFFFRGLPGIAAQQQIHEPPALWRVQQLALGEQLRDDELLLCPLQAGNRGLFCVDGTAVRRGCKDLAHQGLTVPADVLPVGRQFAQEGRLQLSPLAALLGAQPQVVLQIQLGGR